MPETPGKNSDMSKKVSSGILLYRIRPDGPEFFLVHPGGPFWKKKDLHAWSIPKGETEVTENLLETAVREFLEETGTILNGEFRSLTPVRQKSGKYVHCYALEGDLDPSSIISNMFEMEWPPSSGQRQSFPEVDRAEWFNAADAKEKINESQYSFIKELLALI